MRSRYRIVDSEGVYFLTATVVEWIPALVGCDACDVIIDSLRYCRAHKGLRVYAYVIMDNHVHLVAEAPDLVAIFQAFKAHTAKGLVRVAKTAGRTWLLNQFEYFKKGYKGDSQHQVWQEGGHPQLIQGEDMLRQKIVYVHENPVRRGYVDAPEHWRYSSARNYALGESSVLEIDALPL